MIFESKWITHNTGDFCSPDDKYGNPSPYFRRAFDVDGEVASAVLFVSGKVRSDLVALCALLALLLCQVLNTTEALSGFSNSTVVMMIGLFIVGGGIFQTGLAKMIGSKVMTLAGNSELRLFLQMKQTYQYQKYNPYLEYSINHQTSLQQHQS